MRSPLAHILLATLILIGALALYASGYAALSRESASVAGLEQQIESTAQAVSRVASIRAALTELSSDEIAVQSYFVSEASVVSFINDLEARGLAQGATVSVLSVAKSGTASRPALHLALSIKGTFDAVMRTVGIVEYAPYALSISSLAVSAGQSGTWNADLSIEVGSVPTVATTTTSSL
jgi:hypothetical protein